MTIIACSSSSERWGIFGVKEKRLKKREEETDDI